MANIDYKSKKNTAKHIFPSFSNIFSFIIILKRITKTTYHEIHGCYAMQILEQKENKSNKEEWSQRIER